MAIDFVKAFDSVNRVALLMWHRCDPYYICSTLRHFVVTELYTGNCTEIFKGELRVILTETGAACLKNL